MAAGANLANQMSGGVKTDVNRQAEPRLPQLVEGVDVRTLPIGPHEAFVLSRVDGRSSDGEIAMVTGLEPGFVVETLARLQQLGAVHYAAPSTTERPAPERSSAPPGGRLSRPAVEAPRRAASDPAHPAAALYDPSELDEVVDLDLPRKRAVLDHYYRLDSFNHYELLGIALDADKKAIKDAYFAAVSVFHPDRYFGKNLGAFKPKLERVFQRLTQAHDVLTRSKSRAEYDQYLAAQRRTRNLEQALADERASARELDEVRRRIEEAARVTDRASHRPPTPTPSGMALDPNERRRALARKLAGGTIPPGARRSAPPTSTRDPVVQEMVADDLKRRYEQSVTRARDDQVTRYIEAADLAQKEGNVVSAANALRVAVTLRPDDEELKARLEQTQERANQELAETYRDQAQYEERSGRFAEAALSYERAARGKPTAQLFERAAFCLQAANGDLRKAGELGKRAVTMAPKAAEPRVTLAKVYVKAGMKESALLEFERAAQLAPDDDSIKDWIKRLKRGEV